MVDFTRQTTVSMTVTAANQFTIAVTQTPDFNPLRDASVTTCKAAGWQQLHHQLHRRDAAVVSPARCLSLLGQRLLTTFPTSTGCPSVPSVSFPSRTVDKVRLTALAVASLSLSVAVLSCEASSAVRLGSYPWRRCRRIGAPKRAAELS